MAHNIHVVHSNGEWKVRREGSTRACKVFNTKESAVKYGRKVGKESQVEVYIHRKDGRISARNSYGKDNYPPKG